MIINGYIPYTTTAFNMFFDFDMQKLRAIEFGAQPSFTLNYTQSRFAVFAGDFASHRDRVLEVFKEFSENFHYIQGRPMIRHERQGDIVRLEYEGGVRVIINYGDTAYEGYDYTVEAMDYIVIGGRAGDNAGEKATNYVTQGESGRIHIRIALGGGLLCVLLIAAYIFHKTGIFGNRRHTNDRADV